MPSRCANTGTRASACTRATRLLPPRGTITSIVPSSPASIIPTAARSRVGTSWIASSGRRGRAQALDHRGVDRPVRAVAVRAAAQDRGIAGLEAQRAGVGGDVRPALVDDADDAERHAHALDGHAVRPRPALRHRADRIGERAHHVEPVRHRGDALVVEREAVEERPAWRRRPWLRPGPAALAARMSALRARIAAAIAASALSFCAADASASARAAALRAAGRCRASGRQYRSLRRS